MGPSWMRLARSFMKPDLRLANLLLLAGRAGTAGLPLGGAGACCSRDSSGLGERDGRAGMMGLGRSGMLGALVLVGEDSVRAPRSGTSFARGSWLSAGAISGVMS